MLHKFNVVMLVCVMINFYITVWYPVSADNIEFTFKPKDFTYVFNKSEIELKWEYKTTPSNLKPSPIIWRVLINGTRETFALIALDKVKLFKPCLNKCKITKPATLRIENLTDNDFTTYDIDLTVKGVANHLKSNTTVVKAVPSSINLIPNKTAEEGRNVSLNCQAEGIPPPNYKWIKRGSNVVLSNDSVLLVSERISRNQTGWYQCTANNGFGNTASADVYLDVYYSPSTPTIKKLKTSNSGSFVGQNITFCCYADGNPRPSYSWIVPNRPSVRQSGKCFHVELHSSEYFGNYTCFVNNSIGGKSRSKNFQQLFRPKKINRITHDSRPFGIFISWNKTMDDGGSKVLHYIISICEESGCLKPGNTTQTSYDVQKLRRNTNYTICVQAENIVGKSNKTCALIQTVNEGKPEQPGIPKVVHQGKGEVDVLWEAPNAGISYYIVKYRKEGWKDWIEENETNTLSCELKDLEPGYYVVQIIAVNKHGGSFPSGNKTFTIKISTTTLTPETTSTSTDVIPEKTEGSSDTKIITIIIIIISVVLVFLVIIAVVIWLKRRSVLLGREEPPPEPDDRIAGLVNGDVYAMVNTSKKQKKQKKQKKKEKNPNDLIYAELSDLAPAAAEDKPVSYEPTDYADITHMLTPKADLVYSNVAPRCSEEGAYANVQELKKCG